MGVTEGGDFGWKLWVEKGVNDENDLGGKAERELKSAWPGPCRGFRLLPSLPLEVRG